MKMVTTLVFLGAVSLWTVGGCKAADEAKSENDVAATATDEAKEEASQERNERKKRPKKDRGEASMKLGDTLWQAESARASVRGSALRISAARMDMADGKATRQQITLILPNYQGPGTYKVQPGGSMFVGVGFNTDQAKKAASDKEVADMATKAITGAETIMLMNATAVVESADDQQVVGTFSQPAFSKYPAISEGKFRAVIKQKK